MEQRPLSTVNCKYEKMINKFKKYRGKGNMKTTLVIMAAGIGSRFGGGIKQLAPVGLNGEIIMDYTLLLEISF